MSEPASEPTQRRSRRWRGLRGLRGRATLAFGGVALCLGLLTGAAVWLVVSQYVVAQRQSSTVADTAAHAAALEQGLAAAGVAVPDVLALVGRGTNAGSILFHRGAWYTSTLGLDHSDLPAELRDSVLAGNAARQRVAVDGEVALVVGVPLATGAYFEVVPLDDLDRAANVLAIALAAATFATAAGGLLLGRWATVPALRPLTALTDAVADVARGRYDRRIPVGDDPDLAPIAGYFNETVDALQRRMQRDARFAADVSHELRGPLTTMVAAVELLAARRGALPPDAAELLDVLRSEIRRFELLVADLLEMSRDDAGGLDLQLTTVDPVALVRHSLAPELRGRIVVTPAAERTDLCTDKRRLERVVGNLVENAESHGRGLTAVTVDATDGEVRILVEDAGPGVSPGVQDRIFEPFARGCAAARGVGGAGLGLALADRHVTLLGGRLDVEPAPGSGARFVVSLPIDGPP